MFKNIFGSINKSIIVVIIITLLLAIATLFEREAGAALTLKLFYHSWWLWSLMIFGVVAATYQVFVMRKLSITKLYSAFIHGSFVFIVCGAVCTHFFSQEAFLMLRVGESSNIMLNDRQQQVAELPFYVELNEFTVERYGGSGMPSNYISDITIIDGESKRDFFISMNNIVRYGDYKLYQSSYDGDELGSVLMINNDYWGSLITYIGYALLMLGMAMVFFSRKSRFKELLRKLTATLILCFVALSVEAQNITQEQNIKDISTIPVQAASGRVEPFSTFANSVVQKLYKDRSYNGIKSEVIVLEMLAGNPRWQSEPIIKLESENLQKELKRKSEYVTYSEFFLPDGRYVLTDIMNHIYEKKQDRLTRTDKELLKLDERINIIYQLYAQMLPAIVPIAGSTEKWISLAAAKEAKLPNSASELENIITLFNDGADADALNSAIIKFTQKQTEHTVIENRVSHSRLASEAWSNNFNITFFVAILVIVMGVMGIVTFLLESGGRKPIFVVFEKIVANGVLLGILALTFNVALRWYVAGRVPMSNSYETVLCVAWTLLFCGWIFRRVSILVVSAISFVAGCFLMISYVGGLDPQITPLVPILNSHWLLFHVATIAVSYGLFALSAVMGVIFMIVKSTSPNSQNIENISVKMTALNELSQLVGVLFLTTGIFLGAIWANVSWGRYWGWDPKETWALITMFAYVINIHLFMSKKYYSKYLINLLAIFTVGLVLMTFFGVNYFFGGMHAYGGEHSFPIGWISGIVIALIILVIIANIRMKNGKFKK